MQASDGTRIYGGLVLIGVIVGLGSLSLTLLSPFLAAIAWALVLAVAFQTPWRALQRRMPRRRSLAAGLLTLAIGILVLLPMAILFGVIAEQVNKLAVELITRLNTAHVRSFSDLFQLPAVTSFLDRLKDRAGVGPEEFQRMAATGMQRLSAALPSLSARLAMGLFDAALTFFMSLFLLFFFLRDGEAMATATLELLPLDPEARDKLGASVSRMLRAIFRGSLLCALAQGLLGGISWWLAGLPLPALAGAAMGAFSLLPLGGTALVWVPGSLWAWSSGHPGAGIFLFLWGTLITTFLADNILRPLLIRGSEELSTLVVILGVFGGMAAFGLLGLFIGPVALALTVSLLEYLRGLARQAQPGDRLPGPEAPWCKSGPEAPCCKSGPEAPCCKSGPEAPCCKSGPEAL